MSIVCLINRKALLASVAASNKKIQGVLTGELEYLLRTELKQSTQRLNKKELLILLSPIQEFNSSEFADLVHRRVQKQLEIIQNKASKLYQLERIFYSYPVHSFVIDDATSKLPEIYFFIHFSNERDGEHYYNFLKPLCPEGDITFQDSQLKIRSVATINMTEQDTQRLEEIHKASSCLPFSPQIIEARANSSEPAKTPQAEASWFPSDSLFSLFSLSRHSTLPKTSEPVVKQEASILIDPKIHQRIPASMNTLLQKHPNRFKFLSNTLFYFDNDGLKRTKLTAEERKAERACFKNARTVLSKKSQGQQGIKLLDGNFELKRKGAHRKIRVYSTKAEIDDVAIHIFNRVDYK